jgi:hypothetical protein
MRSVGRRNNLARSTGLADGKNQNAILVSYRNIRELDGTIFLGHSGSYIFVKIFPPSNAVATQVATLTWEESDLTV